MTPKQRGRAKAATKWNKGDECWRAYARRYGVDPRWYPEIRPAKVLAIAPDGLLRVGMLGQMPGSEGKRNPGAWIAWNVEPKSMYSTPEKALAVALRLAGQANLEDAVKAA